MGSLALGAVVSGIADALLHRSAAAKTALRRANGQTERGILAKAVEIL
jgi:hypothetical protein